VNTRRYATGSAKKGIAGYVRVIKKAKSKNSFKTPGKAQKRYQEE
jgi:hypothetical protein